DLVRKGMKSSQHTIAESSTSPSSRASSVMLGRQDYISATLRLTGMELYKIRRRLMSKVLSLISILSTVSLFGLIALAAFLMAKNGTPPEAIQRFSEALRLPGSLSLVVQLLLTLGQILIIILVSTIFGGEHTDKTVRLLTWSFLIEPAISVIALLGKSISGPLGSFFQSLPDYLIGSNISNLLSNQDPYIFPTPTGSHVAPQLSNIHSLLVLCIYLVVFIGVALWVNMRRDVLI